MWCKYITICLWKHQRYETPWHCRTQSSCDLLLVMSSDGHNRLQTPWVGFKGVSNSSLMRSRKNKTSLVFPARTSFTIVFLKSGVLGLAAWPAWERRAGGFVWPVSCGDHRLVTRQHAAAPSRRLLQLTTSLCSPRPFSHPKSLGAHRHPSNKPGLFAARCC